jgi:hypothetical protein
MKTKFGELSKKPWFIGVDSAMSAILHAPFQLSYLETNTIYGIIRNLLIREN